MAAKYQRRRDEEELNRREESRMKVLEWMGSTSDAPSAECDMDVECTSA